VMVLCPPDDPAFSAMIAGTDLSCAP
jgi:hypothetical protein